MADEASDLTEEVIELCVAVAVGAVALELSGLADAASIDTVRSSWPDAVSADALLIGEQVVMALAAVAQLDADALFAIASALTPTTEEDTNNG